jgi:hypothetical protein
MGASRMNAVTQISSGERLFPLTTSSITVRERKMTCRELTHGERSAIAKIISDDKFRGPALFAAMGCIEPKFSEDDAADMPADVVNDVAREVMRLSGLLRDETKND